MLSRLKGEKVMVVLSEIIRWNKNFETGLPQIDEEHKGLVHLVNTMASHLVHKSDDVISYNFIFDELFNYASLHFKAEENIWHQSLSEDLWEEDHKRLHDSFVSTVQRLKNEGKNKPLNKVIEDTLSFLTHWVAYHILDCDKRMAKVVMAVQSGLSIGEAKKGADKEMRGATRVLIETILSMYNSLSTRTLQLMQEVIERQKAEANLRLTANAFDNALDSICIIDADFNVINANPAFYQTIEKTKEEVLGNDLKSLKSGFNDEEFFSKMWSVLCDVGHWSGEIWNRAKNGELYAELLTLSSIKDENGVVVNYVGVFSNITHLIKQRHNLEHIAHHDALTGLPNRLLLTDRLELAIANAERSKNSVAICYLDLDGFKPVNDRLGHCAGDHVLREIAARLKKTVRGNDTVARIGGDEFVVILVELKTTNSCEILLERLLQEVARPVHIKDNVAEVSGSIGVTIFPQDGDEPDTLLQRSDATMYLAKQSGKSKYRLYSSTPGQF